MISRETWMTILCHYCHVVNRNIPLKGLKRDLLRCHKKFFLQTDIFVLQSCSDNHKDMSVLKCGHSFDSHIYLYFVLSV